MEIGRGALLVFGILFLFSFVGFVEAIELDDLSCENAVNYKSLIVGNPIPDEAPFKNEIINLYLSEEIYGNIIIEEGIIKDFSCLENEDASYKIIIKDVDSLKKFIDSEDFVQTYKEMKKSGEIEVKGIGLGKKIKLGFVNFFLKFF